MKHKPQPKGSLIAALDVGSAKLACFIARVIDDEGNIEVIGVGHHPSKGVKNGHVTDLDDLETAIRHCVHAAENMAAEITKGYPLREIAVTLSNVHAASGFHKAEVSVSGHEITDNDVRRAMAGVQADHHGQTHDPIHMIPIHYTLDGQADIAEPRGMVGQKLGVDIHMVNGEVAAMRNISTAIERSHLDVSAFALGGYCSALSCLVQDEMELGAVVVDIGAGTTSIAVVEGGALIYADGMGIGGAHITNDIAKGLTTNLSAAERLKTLYGSAMGAQSDDKELIDVPRLGEEEGSEPNHIPRSMLVGIIQPRAEEILELVRARLSDSGLRNPLNRRIVLTGGGALLPGLNDLAGHVFDKSVRTGRPLRINGLPDAVSGPGFSSAAGLLNYICARRDEMPADIMEQVKPENMLEQLVLWFKENW